MYQPPNCDPSLSGDKASSGLAPEVSHADIRDQIARILSSPDFVVPDRARRFLQYLVDETLAGRADRIKAYSIALEVFGRDESFDAQNDPVVRIEAGRIRRAIERYYLLAGQGDPVIVAIPKGGYVPSFEWQNNGALNCEQSAGAAPPKGMMSRKWTLLGAGLLGVAVLSAVILIVLLAAPRNQNVVAQIYAPRVVVVPFSDLAEAGPSKNYAFGLTAEIVNQLARFKDITVVAGRPNTGPSATNAKSVDLYELTGSVRTSNNRIRVTAQLTKAESKEVIWTEAYEHELRVGDILTLQKDVAQKVAIAIGQPYGVVLRADSLRVGERPPDDLAAYSCTLSYFAYQAEVKPQRHAEVRTCLECTVAAFPGYATAWALLSLIYIDEDRYQYNPVPDRPKALVRALDAAKRSVALDPHNVRALQALMLASYFNQDVETGNVTGARALALNPNDMEVLGEYGVRTALAGNWAVGATLIEKALAHNPGNSTITLRISPSERICNAISSALQNSLAWRTRRSMACIV